MNRIKLLRLGRNLTQGELCKIINISQASLSGYENGKYEPDNKTLIHLANYFNVTVDYLLGCEIILKSEPAKTIPIFRCLKTGFVAETSNQILRYEGIGWNMSTKEDYIGLQMLGDSMEPRIQNGDTIIIRRQNQISSGDIAAVLIGEKLATIKKVYKHENGLILIPLNPKYNPDSYTSEDMERLPVVILGKAVELRGKC